MCVETDEFAATHQVLFISLCWTPLLSLIVGDPYRKEANAAECVWHMVAMRFRPFFCAERVLPLFASPWV